MRNIKGWSVSIIFFFLILVVSIGYVFLRSRDFFNGPILSIENENGLATDNPLMELKGTAGNISFLTLNGRQIFTDEKGDFSEKLLLTDGYNIMTVEAKDRFGRVVTKKLKSVYKQSDMEKVSL